MVTGSRDEQRYLANVQRIAGHTERIAIALERLADVGPSPDDDDGDSLAAAYESAAEMLESAKELPAGLGDPDVRPAARLLRFEAAAARRRGQVR